MKERWDLNRRAVRLLCHLDRKYFLCTLFSSLTTAIAPYIPIYFSAKIIDALTAGAGGKTLALYAALTVGLTALIGLAGALLKMHADVGEAELDRLVDWQHAEKAMDLPYALIEDRKTALLRERIEMETQTGYNVYYYAVTAGGLVRYAVQIAAAVLLTFSLFRPGLLSAGAKLALLAGIVILLSILILLTLWSVLSQHIHRPAASAAESEPASSEVMVPQNLVPNFIGMDYTQVQNNREYTSMYLFYVTEEYSDTAPAGQIIQQEPSADTVLKAGETIRLVVSKGPQMAEMPNIIGFTQDGAVKELEARGLVASCFMVVNDGSYASGCVVRTSEEPGTKVEVGTVITVYIAADPSVQITATPEEPAATEPTTTEPAPPETTDPTPTEPEYNTD